MPASRKKKPLAVGNSISDLNCHAENVKINIKTPLQCKQYCNSLNDIFKKAEARYHDGDDENAYILYMRFLYIFEAVKKTFEYQKQKKFYNDLIRSQNILNAVERAESLSESLKERYKQLNDDRSSKNEENQKPGMGNQDIKKDARLTQRNGSLNSSGQDNGSDLSGKQSEAKGPSGLTSSLPDVPDLDDEIDAQPSARKSQKVDPWIAPDELYNLLKTASPDSILIMDTRPPDEFLASRIKHNSVLNIRDELLKPGANVNSIERRLAREIWETWITRGSKDYIIIMDHDSTRENSKQDCPIQILKDAIFKWDPSGQVKSEPKLLESGFSGWQLYYPSLCTNPFYKKSKFVPPTHIPDPTKLLSSLNYPTLPGLKDNESPQPNFKNVTNPGLKPEQKFASKDGDQKSERDFEDGDLLAKLRRELEAPSDKKPITRDVSGEISSRKLEGDPRSRVGSSGAKDINTGGFGGTLPSSVNRDGVLNGGKGNLQNFPLESTGIPNLRTDNQNGNYNNTQSGMEIPGRAAVNQMGSNIRENNDILHAKYDDKGFYASKFASHRPDNSRNGEVLHATYGEQNNRLPETGRQYSGSFGREGEVGPQDVTRADQSNLSDGGHAQARPGDNVPGSNVPASPNHSKYATIPRMGPGAAQQFYSKDGADLKSTQRSNSMPYTTQNSVPHRMFSSNSLPAQPKDHKQTLGSNILSPQNAPIKPGTTLPGTGTAIQSGGTLSSGVPPFQPKTSLQQPNSAPKVSGTHPSAAPSKPGGPASFVPNPSTSHQSSVPTTHPSFVPFSFGSSTTTVPNSSTNYLSSVPKPGSQASVPSANGSTVSAAPSGNKVQPTVTQSVPRTNQTHSMPFVPQERPQTSDAIKKISGNDSDVNEPGFVTSPGLPHGWEKAIDNKTGRVYYIDHTTKSTHWELPPDFYASREKSVAQRQATERQKRKAPEPPTAKELKEPQSSLKRSLSTPNLAELEENKENEKPVRPVIDRSSKPVQTKSQLVDRSTKPLSKSRLQNLSPVYGSKGQNLTGLKNLGNTCYMNAVIQCLSSTRPLAQYFNTGNYMNDLNPNSMNRRPEELAKELAFLLKVLWSAQYRSVSPIDLKATVGRFASQFSGSKQHDSHEFLMFFMDGIHEDTNKIRKRLPMKEQNNDNVPDHIGALNAWKEYTKNNNSIVVDLFQGQFRSTVACKTCGKKSVTFDVFSCLSLQLTSKNSCTLDDCIRAFTRPEMIGGNNSWKCSNCKTYREATKTIELWRLPPIVIVQLKRFSSDGMWHNKLQTNVDFPVSSYEMGKHLVASQRESTRYDLYAVVNHYGSFECGHYISYCSNQKRWYKFDDNAVSEMDKGAIKSSAAYLLFYTAEDFKAYQAK